MIFKSQVKVNSEEEMGRLGERLAELIQPGEVVYLCGDLGVGKTSLARSMIHAYGFDGRVKSPSYGLVETYPIKDGELAHLDLYRLGEAEELFDLGLESYLDQGMRLLIEWPERADSYLPAADWRIIISDTESTTASECEMTHRHVLIESNQRLTTADLTRP